MVEEVSLKNSVTGAVLNLDMVTGEDYVLKSIDWGYIQSTHHSYKYVDQIGVYVTDTSLETRDVNIEGWVIANTEASMTKRKAVLNRFFNPKQPIDLFYKTYKIRFLPNSSIRYSAVIADNNEVICKFLMEGYCPDPLFSEQSESKVTAASTIPMFRFPLVIPKNPPGYGVVFGVRKPSLIVSIYNSGAVDVGMRIVFRAVGTVVNPSLTNVNTQEQFKILKTMNAGEQVVVSTKIGEKYIEGTVGGVTSNYYKYRDLDSDWLQLRVGDNLFRYDAEANVENLEVYIYYYNRFLEVQECY